MNYTVLCWLRAALWAGADQTETVREKVTDTHLKVLYGVMRLKL